MPRRVSAPMTIDALRMVLVRPTHPGNIGGVARAMKTMNLERLYLVDPKRFPDEEAHRRAAGADDVLTDCRITASLADAVADCRLVIGTTARRRTLSWPSLTPEDAAARLVAEAGAVALVFGPEHSGLSNQDLALCQYTVSIPTNAAYSSLNLACAVQIMAYEIAGAARRPASGPEHVATEAMARSADLERLYAHLEATLERLEFLKTSPPTKLMRKLIRLFNRAQPTDEEVRILRGILSAVEQRVDAPRDNT